MAFKLGKLFPALFSNPEEEALNRKMRINASIRRFDQEVKKQDGFIKQYVTQAAQAKRTGDVENYKKARNALSFTFTYRKRAQRALNSIQIFSTMSSQMEAYKNFCGAVNDLATSMGNSLSVKDVADAQRNLERGMMQARTAEELIDQVLNSFDSSFDEMSTSESVANSDKDKELDAMISQMIASKENLTEDKISMMLNGATSQDKEAVS